MADRQRAGSMYFTKECTVVPHLLCVVEGFLHVLPFHLCTFLQLYKHFYLLCNVTRHIDSVPVCGMFHKNRKNKHISFNRLF